MQSPAETPTFVRVSELRKTYLMGTQAVHALDGIDLEIPRSTFSVVMGPSGSGKSTFLYLLGGLDRPTSGSLEIDGQPVETFDENQLAVFRRKVVGFIFQSFNLISSMTALENVAFPMQFARTSRRQQRRRAAELLEQVGLADRANHRPTELSGGQQQRVAIARTLMMDPEVLLFDEPTAALDPEITKEVAEIIRNLSQTGITQVVVTHEVDFARKVASQVIYLEKGRIIESGTAAIFQSPQTSRFAEFLMH